MALEIKQSYNKHLTIEGVTYNYRTWTAKDRKSWMKMVSNPNASISEKVMFNALVRPCLEDKNKELPSSVKMYLFYAIRKDSLGEDIEGKITCKTCKKTFETSLEKFFDKIEYKTSTFGEPVVLNETKAKVYFSDLQNFDNKNDITKEPIEYLYDEIASYVFSIELNDVIYTTVKGDENYISPKDIKNFLESLPINDYTQLSNYFADNKSECECKIDVSCTHCNDSFKAEPLQVSSFLWTE